MAENYSGKLEIVSVNSAGEEVSSSVEIHLPASNIHRKKSDGSWENLDDILDNEGSGNVTIDYSLSTSGQAADAKVTGDELRNLKNNYASKEYVDEVIDNLPDNYEQLEKDVSDLKEDLNDKLDKETADTLYAPIGSTGGQGGTGFTQTQLSHLCNALKGAKFESEEASLSAKSFVESVLGESDEPTQPDNPEEPTITLSSISAIYNGGDVVEGTNASDLQGIVVTGHYSDGSTKTVNGWNITGVITVGSNTFTITYGGKSTTITVVGIPSQTDETVELNWRLVNTTGAGATELNKEANNGFYSDGGDTAYSDARFPTTNIVFGLTDVVNNDTNVKITCSPSKNVFQCFVFGCTQSEGVLVNNNKNNLEEPIYFIKPSSETFAYGWSSATHEWNYTIKAGYRLCVASILTGLDALNAITVEVV